VRSAFQIVSGRRLYRHPSRLDRPYVLDKLLVFHREHGTSPPEILRDLNLAAAQIPNHEHANEAAPLQERCERARRSRRREPQQLGTLLVVVLARLGVTGLESKTEARSPIANVSDASTR
jgi:hypothetical protein